MPVAILGISAFYHDSAAALIIDGNIIAAAQEERFSRKKNDSAFPEQAINYVLQEGGLNRGDLTAISFYDKPLLKFERLLETHHVFSPWSLTNFVRTIPVWIKEKLFIRKYLQKQFGFAKGKRIPVLFPEHHLSHAASAFYPSPFEEAAILTIDGVGEWATASICRGRSNQIEVLKELRFPHSLGLFYAAFTYYLGFEVNGGEYKLMGLAPYGNADSLQTAEFKEKILAELIDVREDGSILLNMKWFEFATKTKMINDRKWKSLFGVSRRAPESEISQSHMNLAFAVQEITGMVVIKMANTAQKLTGSNNLVIAGGVALNCVANSQIRQAGIFENIWVQPAAGDAGGALGAALAAHYISRDKNIKRLPEMDIMQNAYLGPGYADSEILKYIRKYDPVYEYFQSFDDLTMFVSRKIAEGNVIGWFQDRMEFGPRALGNRSILGDPGNPEMQKIINSKIKFREGFRPFAPAVLLEDAHLYFTPNGESPFMLFVSQIKEDIKKPEPENYRDLHLHDRLNHCRSDFPAITHVDYSARIQTVSKEANPKFWNLIHAFKNITGYGMLINTSFNVRNEPIVCTPDDAYLCFMKTEMDFLVIGNYLFDKSRQRISVF